MDDRQCACESAMHHGLQPNDKNRYCVRPTGNNSYTARRRPWPARFIDGANNDTHTALRPVLKREHKNAATLAISKENRNHGGRVHVHLPLQTQATACWSYCRCDR
jgi:hypothetical protein